MSLLSFLGLSVPHLQMETNIPPLPRDATQKRASESTPEPWLPSLPLSHPDRANSLDARLLAKASQSTHSSPASPKLPLSIRDPLPQVPGHSHLPAPSSFPYPSANCHSSGEGEIQFFHQPSNSNPLNPEPSQLTVFQPGTWCASLF